jgi:AraC-like DNA-binding protein
MNAGAAHLEQSDLHASATVMPASVPDGVAERRIAVDHELLSVRSALTILDGITIVHGASTARRDLVLHVREHVPALAVHITLQGTARLRGGGCAAGETVRAGESLVLSGHETHEVGMSAGVANAGLRLNFTRDYLDRLAQRCPELATGELGRMLSGQLATTRRIEPMAPEALADLFGDLRHAERYGSLRRLFLESTALSLLVRALSRRSLQPAPSLGARARDRMLEARERLLASMGAPPTLPALARSLGTNEFRLKRDFKLMFGEPVHAFLLRRRLEHARVLLRDRDRSVKEIATEVGYAHASHFSTAFRKRFGVPPTAVRR